MPSKTSTESGKLGQPGNKPIHVAHTSVCLLPYLSTVLFVSMLFCFSVCPVFHVSNMFALLFFFSFICYCVLFIPLVCLLVLCLSSITFPPVFLTYSSFGLPVYLSTPLSCSMSPCMPCLYVLQDRPVHPRPGV